MRDASCWVSSVPIRLVGSSSSHAMSSSDGDVSTASDRPPASSDGDVGTEDEGPVSRPLAARAAGASRPLAASHAGQAPVSGVSRPLAAPGAGQVPLSGASRSVAAPDAGQAPLAGASRPLAAPGAGQAPGTPESLSDGSGPGPGGEAVVAPPLVTGLQPPPACCLSAAMRVVPLGVDLTANVRSRAREDVQRDLMRRLALGVTGVTVPVRAACDRQLAHCDCFST